MERYESLGPVGEGSYGTVLKCRHRDSGRLVAIKKFMDSDDDKTVKKIALREIKLLRQLRHDNLVNLLEVWKRRRRWYLVFEFVDRTLLDDLEQSLGGLDMNTSRQYLYQILRAVAFCHQQNIIHRDIKPENILISQGGVVKLCDFGFARTMASTSEGAVYTDYVATRWYRAPELLVGDIKYGKPVDVWAVGCLLIEMLTGQPLFPGDSDLDQIYHIVRCFGNLTSHHQELFYRNPIFSGARLPECSGRVTLQQRFPTITSTSLDLAQSCLEMDPERRAQCSELLEHPLFTQDSFHIRFLDELNAKIQKDHRENSTLPKITKAENNPKQERDDEKNCRGKDKKHPEDADEKVVKGKLEKTKGKQHLKVSKTIRNKSEPLVSTKQPKTLGNKAVHNAAQPPTPMKSKPGKATGVELTKESALSKSTKTLYLFSSEATKSAANPNASNTEEAIPKHERVVFLEPRDKYLDNTKDTEYNGSEIWKRSKSEQSQECGKSWNNTNTILSSSPEASLKSAVDRTDRQPSRNDHVEVITPIFISKPCKNSNTSDPQTDRLTAESQQRTSECPSKTPSTSHLRTNKSNLSLFATPSKNTLAQFSAVCIEVSPAHSTMTVAEEISNPKLSKVGSPSKGLPEDFTEAAEDKHITEAHRCLRMRSETKIAAHHIQISQASGGYDKMNLESSEPSCLQQESLSKSKIITETRTTSMQNEETSIGNTNLKTLKVLDKENRQDLALPVPISATAMPSVIQSLEASGMISRNEIRNNSIDFESEVKSVKAVHPKSKLDYYHTQSTSTPRTQKTTFPRDTRNKSDNPEKSVSTKISTSTPDDKASSRSSVSEFDCRVPSSSPPPPPPPPSSSPLLMPPSSASLIHPFSGVGTNSPMATDHLTMGAGVHPGTSSLRHVDKLRHHGGLHTQQARQFLSSHISGPLTFQAREKSPIRERSFLSDHCNLSNSGSIATDKNKSHIHLPDLRSSVLPELRGREGKHNKATTKDQRKDKHPVSTGRPLEPQEHGHNSTDAYTAKQT